MKLIYLKKEDIDLPDYISFYEKYHGDHSFQERRARIHWYFHSEGFKLLIAIQNEKFVGQSCAYKTTAIIHGKETEWWWGVDMFVLEEMRGQGIGKILQKKLHEDCPNFSSASYSAINGIIKKKCGGHNVFVYHQYYYPVSCYVSLCTELFLKKVINRKCRFPRVSVPYLYYAPNSMSMKMTGYEVRELAEKSYDKDLSQFMEENLADTDFHVKRSVSFLHWKYVENTSIRFQGLEILKDGQREGVIMFTAPYNGVFTVSKTRISKVLDAIVSKNSSLTMKMLFMVAIQFFHEKGDFIDGLVSLLPANYHPCIKYPIKSSQMLSTYSGKAFTNGYLTFIDQDMEQMYEHN